MSYEQISVFLFRYQYMEHILSYIWHLSILAQNITSLALDIRIDRVGNQEPGIK